MSEVKISPKWKPLLEGEFEKEYFKKLTEEVRQEYLKRKVFPHPSRIFRALDLCPPEEVRVVILGQDPYHTPGVADGLAFSTFEKNRIPPSLQNIFKEIEEEFGIKVERSPDLTRWAKQGVLLLNASLSVRSGMANSHADFGWHLFTDSIIATISEKCENVVFMLWGSFAGQKKVLIDSSKHLILTSPHPSPFSAHKGFFGNNHFKLANDYLATHNRQPIDWR